MKRIVDEIRCLNLEKVCDYELDCVKRTLGREPAPDEVLYWVGLFSDTWHRNFCLTRCGYSDLCGVLLPDSVLNRRGCYNRK